MIKDKAVIFCYLGSELGDRKALDDKYFTPLNTKYAGKGHADMFGGVTNKEIFDYIKDSLDFDQLIWEFGDKNNPAWVHCSFISNGNRRQILRAIKKNGRTGYELY